MRVERVKKLFRIICLDWKLLSLKVTKNWGLKILTYICTYYLIQQRQGKEQHVSITCPEFVKRSFLKKGVTLHIELWYHLNGPYCLVALFKPLQRTKISGKRADTQYSIAISRLTPIRKISLREKYILTRRTKPPRIWSNMKKCHFRMSYLMKFFFVCLELLLSCFEFDLTCGSKFL